jgi:hypothetical protein
MQGYAGDVFVLVKATFLNGTTTSFGAGDTCVYTVISVSRLVGQSNANALTSLTLAPNPTVDNTTLYLPKGIAVLRLEIIDAQGRVVQTLTNLSANSSVTFGQDLAMGIYRVVAHTEAGPALSASWIKNGR